MTVRVHASNIRATSAASAPGARNDEPSRLPINASRMSVGVLTFGGEAGSSIRSIDSATIASTTALTAADVTACPVPPPSTVTVPGIALARAVIAGLSSNAGRHRSDVVTVRPCGWRGTRIDGTTAPRAASRTPSRATCPNHSRLAPMPSRP